MANLVRVVLNHPNIRRILMEDATVAQILQDSANSIEAQLPAAHESSVAQAKADGLATEGHSVTTFNEDAEPSDRQRRFVGLEPAENADFVYGTIPTAVERAGGVKKGGV